MRYTKISLALCVFLLSGCSLLDFGKDMTVEQKETVLHDAAQGAMAITLSNVYEDSDERLKQAHGIKKWIDAIVLDGLAQNPLMAIELAADLFNVMPPEYNAYMRAAINLLSMYAEVTGDSELVGENNYRMVVAMFKGIYDGCQSVIDYETAN